MDGEEVDTMMMGWWKRKKMGNEQMEHSVDPPFSARARLTGGLVTGFVSHRPRFGLPSKLASFRFPRPRPLACPLGFRWCDCETSAFLKEQCNRDFPTSEHPFELVHAIIHPSIHHTHTIPATRHGICLL